jgi:hypothetical protein
VELLEKKISMDQKSIQMDRHLWSEKNQKTASNREKFLLLDDDEREFISDPSRVIID